MSTKYRHLFFDMDLTVAPAREPILPDMRDLLLSLPYDLTIVSGGTVERIKTQLEGVTVHILGQNGSHAVTKDEEELWAELLDEAHRTEIHEHIERMVASLPHDINPDWYPIEDRGAQITFIPIGNRAPSDIKNTYDPNREKREQLLKDHPFDSEELVVKIGGSTSFDYIHKDRHKGSAVARFIEHMNWDADACIYFGDGLYPGGNDEAVIGVIETQLVEDHHDTYRRLRSLFT
jgi:phosphomannomutase